MLERFWAFQVISPPPALPEHIPCGTSQDISFPNRNPRGICGPLGSWGLIEWFGIELGDNHV